MDKRLVIIGAGGHGKVVADIAQLNGYKEIIFLDDDTNLKRNGIYAVVGTTKDIDKYKDHHFIVGIGNNAIRAKIIDQLEEKNALIVTLIHPSAVIDKTVHIEEGTVVMANAVINADAYIGRGCIINTAATIDHECMLHDYIHVSPGSHLAGNIDVGSFTWIGIGSTISNNIKIKSNCIIGAGSVVIKDVEENMKIAGNPVKIIGGGLRVHNLNPHSYALGGVA